MTISLKRAKGSSHSQNSQCCLTVVWWNASFRNLLSHHSLSNLGGLQTAVPIHSMLHLIFICSICHSHVETLPGQHFWKAQLVLCHAGPVVTARQRSAVTLVPNSEHDRYTASNCRMTGPHHSSHFCFLDLVLESHCSSVWIFANSDENQWNSMKIFNHSYIYIYIFSFYKLLRLDGVRPEPRPASGFSGLGLGSGFSQSLLTRFWKIHKFVADIKSRVSCNRNCM